MSPAVRGTAVRMPNGALFAIGPRPPQGPWVARAGYSMLVLAADSYQPPAYTFPGVCVILAGVPDDRRRGLDGVQRMSIKRAAAYATKHIAAGYNALFTCEMGLNRSALTAALTLINLGYSRPQAIALVRRMRGAIALNNPKFVEIIQSDSASAR